MMWYEIKLLSQCFLIYCIDSSLFFWGEKRSFKYFRCLGFNRNMFPFIWLESVTGVILGFMYTMKSHRLSQVDVLGQKHLDYLSMRQHSESNLLTKKRKENRSISIFYIHFYFRVLAEFFCFVFVVFFKWQINKQWIQEDQNIQRLLLSSWEYNYNIKMY